MTFAAGQIPTVDELDESLASIDAQVDDPTSGTTTSTSYTATLTGTTSLSTAFVAARTGHWIGVSCMSLNSGASGPFNQYMSFDITAAGGFTYGPVDADAAETQWTNNNVGGMASRRTYVSGLTPGTTYTVTVKHKVSAQTGTFRSRRLTIE